MSWKPEKATQAKMSIPVDWKPERAVQAKIRDTKINFSRWIENPQGQSRQKLGTSKTKNCVKRSPHRRIKNQDRTSPVAFHGSWSIEGLLVVGRLVLLWFHVTFSHCHFQICNNPHRVTFVNYYDINKVMIQLSVIFTCCVLSFYKMSFLFNHDIILK